MAKQPVILFDGICNLCNHAVQYVIKRDPDSRFKFATLQGDYGKKSLNENHLSANELNSFILIQNNKVYTKSTAALRVARQLKGATRLLYGFIIVPRFIRDGVYSLIAHYRYRWFGKKEECMIPTEDLKKRFLT